MTMKAPRAVADLLGSAMPQISERLTELKIHARWGSIAGPEVARRARPDRLEAGRLTVVVDNSPWLHELTLRAEELTAQLATVFPGVRSLRLTLGAVPKPPEAVREKLPPARALTREEVQSIDEATSAIPDRTLAAAARRLMTKARQFPAERGTPR